MVLLEPQSLREALLDWIPFLEEAFASKVTSISEDDSSKRGRESPEEQKVLDENWEMDQCNELMDKEQSPVLRTNTNQERRNILNEDPREELSSNKPIDNTLCKTKAETETVFSQSFRTYPPFFIAQDLQKDLTELTTLCFELSIYQPLQVNGKQCVQLEASLACRFIKDYFFLLNLERLKQYIVTCYNDYPSVWETYVKGLKGNYFGRSCVFSVLFHF